MAHARILDVDLGPELAPPGVVAVFTGDDLAGDDLAIGRAPAGGEEDVEFVGRWFSVAGTGTHGPTIQEVAMTAHVAHDLP